MEGGSEMKVLELLKAWIHFPGDVHVIVTTVDNPYGDEIRCKGGINDDVIKRFNDTRVISFAVDYADGVNIMCINVDAHSVPIRILRGWD